MPSAPISALASAISASLTCSTVPPVACSTRAAFFHEAGRPMRMAVARVSASTETNLRPPVSRIVRTMALAPSAWIRESLGSLEIRPSSFISTSALPNADEFPMLPPGTMM